MYRYKMNSVMAGIIAIFLASFALPSYADTASYTVDNGNEVDASSYNGYKLYRKWCARCHGTYGQGLSAPNLAKSLSIITKEQYIEVMEEGKTGAIGRMPGWKGNPFVMKGLDDIHNYLQARADGALGAVRPKIAK